MSGIVYGIHPVLELLRADPHRVTRVLIAAGRRDAKVAALIEAARVARVPVQPQPSIALDRLAGAARHQGVVAIVATLGYAEPEAVLKRASSPPLLVVLDGVEDPRNLGAVIRAAAAAGADGLFVPDRRAAGLTPAAVKTAAGAAESLPIARIGNVVAFLKSLKERGIWVAGLDPEGTTAWSDFDLTVPLALVLGTEGKGIRRLARETCDIVLSIPLAAGVQSLNLSVAAGVVLYEAVRQRRRPGGVSGESRPGSEEE